MIHEIRTTIQLIQKISSIPEQSRHTAPEQVHPIDFKELKGIFADQKTEEKEACRQSPHRIDNTTAAPVPFKLEKNDGKYAKHETKGTYPQTSRSTQDFLTRRNTTAQSPNSLSPRPVVPQNTALSAYAAIADPWNGFKAPEQEGLLTLLLEYYP